MRLTPVLALSALIGTCFMAMPVSAYQVPQSVRDKAAQYSRTAKELISSGRVTDGVKVMRLAIQTNPVDPALRMNYVSIMSKKGERSLLDGNRREAIVVFKSVETELLSAAKLFLDAGANENAAHALTQVAQIYRHVYRNEGAARAYFNKALALSPNSPQILSLATG